MKYTIEVSGKGAEAFIHKLTQDQFDRLEEGGVEEDSMDQDDISEVLEHDYLDTENIITGIYPGSDNILIKVIDESGEIVWESDDEFDFEEYEDDYKFNDDIYFSVEDYQKGNFFNYELEIDEEFNPELLSAVTVELLDGRSELLIDIKYNGQEMTKDYGDTVSKGFTYMLSY